MAARQKILQGWSRATVRNMQRVDTGAGLEELTGQVVRRAIARRGIAPLARLRLQLGDQLLERARPPCGTSNAMGASPTRAIASKSFTGW